MSLVTAGINESMLPVSASVAVFQESRSPSLPLGAKRYRQAKRLDPASMSCCEPEGSQMSPTDRVWREGARGRRGVGKSGMRDTIASIDGSLI